MNFISKSRDGVWWTILDLTLNRAVFLGVTIFLARELGPEVFGIMGVLSIFFTFGNVFIESGLTFSLLKIPQPSQNDYDTVFFINICFSLIIYFLFYFLAPFISNFYHNDSLTFILRIYFIGFLVNALKLVPQTKLLKEFHYKKITLLSLPGTILSLCLCVFLTINNYGIWSIIFFYLLNSSITSILFLINCNWKPEFGFTLKNVISHFLFGYKLMIASLLNSFFDNLYNAVIGRYFSIKELGYYDRSFTLSGYPSQLISSVLNKVFLPVFSINLNDKERLYKIYRDVVLGINYLSIPLMSLMVLIAKPLFLILLGDKWIESVLIFQILCLSFIFYPLHSLNLNLLSVFGRSDLFLKLEILKKVIIVISIFSFYGFGLIGLALSTVFTSLLFLLINSAYTGKLTNYSTFAQLSDLVKPIVLTLVIILITLISNYYVFVLFNSNLLSLVITSILFIILYITILYFYDKKIYMLFKNLIS